jgi:hypothetical protein
MAGNFIHPLPGTGKLDPGRTGLSAESFFFVNVSTEEICDLSITCYDDDVYGGAPDILAEGAGGISIELFDPVPLPGDKIGATKKRPMPQTDYKRIPRFEDSQVRIEFEPGKCIKPGSGFILNLRFDETLDGNEGIEVKPSRLVDGKHYGFGQTEQPREGPFTFSDLLKALGAVGGAVPGLIGGAKGKGSGGSSSRSASSLAKEAGRDTRLALRAVLNEEQLDLPLRDLRRLGLSELPGLDRKKAAGLEKIGIRTLADFEADADLARVAFLVDVIGGGSDGG